MSITPEAVARILEKSDYELIHMITVSRGEFISEAIILAEEELNKRGISKETIEAYAAKSVPLTTRKIEVPLVPGLGIRLIHLCIDGIAQMVLFILFIDMFGDMLSGLANDWGFTFLLLSFFLLYYVTFEYAIQATPAKLLTGCVVTNSQKGRASFKQIIIRSLCRFIPLDAISFLFGAGLHDRLSETQVVRKSVLDQLNRNSQG